MVEIAEPIGYGWDDEIIYLPCGGAERSAVDSETGELLPSQRLEGKSLEGLPADPMLAVKISLKPRERRRMELVSDREYPSADAVVSAVESELRGMPVHVFGNGRISAAVPKSQPFNSAFSHPGPVLALRRGADKDWTGRGEIGPFPSCGRVETVLLEKGPLLIRWLTRYFMGGWVQAAYESTIFAGEDFIMLREKSMLDAGIAFSFRLVDADAPQFWCTHGGGEFVKVSQGPVSKPPTRMGLERPGEFIHIDFNSGHFQMSYSWAGLWREGGPLVGVAELRGGHWQMPGRNRIILRKEEKGLSWNFPASGGSREYALVCGEPELFAAKEGLSRFCNIRRKYSDLPLEKVRHWKLDWDIPRRSVPILYPKGTAETWRKKAEAWPELVEAYKRLAAVLKEDTILGACLPAYLLTGEKFLKDKLLKELEDYVDMSIGHAMLNGYIRLIIFTGRLVKVALDAIDVLRAEGELDEAVERRLARKLAFLSHCFADPDYWPWDSVFRDRNDPRSHAPYYWDDCGASICPPNFTTEYYTTTGLFALAYPEHPMAREWTQWAVELFSRNLDTMFYDGGSYRESANYHCHSQGMMTQLAIALLAGGHRDFFEEPRFKANYGYFVENLTPHISLTEAGIAEFSRPCFMNPPKDGKGFAVTNWGNSGHDCSGYPMPPAVAVAAGIYADRDPAYARRLMSAWRMSPQMFCSHYFGFDLLALGHPNLPDAELGLRSRILEGTGAAMRAAQRTPDEVFAWIKCGSATNHNCNDEGGIVLYAKGAPLIGDFGYHTHHEGKREGPYETWKHACVTFGGKNTSFYLGVEQALPPKFWKSTDEYDLLVCHLPVEYILPPGARYDNAVRVPRIEHTRSILFVKPHFFVIYDQIRQTTLKPCWWMHALASQVDVSEGRAFFHGLFGIDLDVRILLPPRAAIGAGQYSVQRHICVEQSGPGEFLAVLAPLRKGETAPSANFDSSGHVLSVNDARGSCRISLGGVPEPLKLKT